MPPTEQNPFDDDEEDEVEVAPSIQPQTIAAPPIPIPKKKTGRPRGSKTRTAPSEGVVDVANATLPSSFEGTAGFDPRDVMTAWPETLDAAKAQGMGPEYLGIRIQRIGEGMHPTKPTWMDTIDGEQVCGDENLSPGQALIEYVTNVVHLPLKSPARYSLFAFLKSGNGTYGKMMVMRLGHPDDIRMQRNAKEQYLRSQRAMGVSGSPMPRYQPLPQQPLPPPPPFPQQMPQPQVAPAQQQQLGVAEMLAQFQAYEAWRQQVIATGAPPPPPAPPPQIIHQAPPAPVLPPEAPKLSKEDAELLEEAKFMRRATALGWAPHQPATTPPAVAAQAANDPVAGIESLLNTFTKIDNLRAKVGAAFGVEATEEKPEVAAEEPIEKPKIVELPVAKAFGRPIYMARETEGFVDWCQQTVMANLETSGELATKMLGGFAKALDGTSFSRLLERLASQGGGPAALAAQARAAGMMGQAPAPPQMNGAPPAMRAPRGPTA